MNIEPKQGQTKTINKVKSSNNQCITCLKPCSMSGLCMKPWPEFPVEAKKKAREYMASKKIKL